MQEGIKRIIILPRPEGVENTSGLISAISQYLTDNAGWFVAPPDMAVEIAGRTKDSTSSLDAIDTKTGKVDMQKYLDAQSSLVETIAKETRSDAVLEVHIVKVKATVRTGVAAWDDMMDPVVSGKSHAFTPFGGKGWVYAATTDMSLWNPAGKLLWKKRRGFAALAMQSGSASKYHERPLTEVYKDSAAMERWLSETLGELAPLIKRITPDTPQISPELQKQLEKAKQAGEQQP
jgi:hypothetical protein